jgi:aryl-alcohol dehydrogenase-like predicted oxidoreductase
MQYRTLGKSDLKASAIGLGTAQFGSQVWGYGTRYSEKDAFKITHAAIDCGINIFDTAEIYSDNQSEIILGEALKGYDRDDFIIITKAAPWNLRHDKLIKAAKSSLKRLGTASIDLYLVHYPNPFVPLRETFDAMEYLVKKGIVRYIGVSNFPRFLVKQTQNVLSSSDIIVNEIEYNLLCRKEERKTVPYCKKQKISIITHSPLCRGMLTGRYSFDNPPIDRARAYYPYAKQAFLKKTQLLFEVVDEIAKKRNVSRVQIALAYNIKDPAFVSIPAAMNEKEVHENAEVPNIRLSSEEISKINDACVSLGPVNYAINYYLIWPFSWMKGVIDSYLQKKNGFER